MRKEGATESRSGKINWKVKLASKKYALFMNVNTNRFLNGDVIFIDLKAFDLFI